MNLNLFLKIPFYIFAAKFKLIIILMKNLVFIAVISVLLISCGKTEEKKNSIWEVSSNLDANNFWINANTLAKGTAHSGLFSSKIDTLVEYGIGIAANFSDLSEKLPKKVNIHCWIYSTVPNLDASLVCDPNVNGKSLNWQAFNLKPTITKANEWTEFKTSFDLPEEITPDSQLKLFFWNPNKQIFFVDDLEISIE